VQRRLATYISEHAPDVAFLSSVEMAEGRRRQPAVVTRFRRALGFAGYGELSSSCARW